jgi:hypothetical protein
MAIDWLTRKQAADKLKMSVRALDRRVKEKIGFPQPSYALGERTPRFDTDMIDAFLKNDVLHDKTIRYKHLENKKDEQNDAKFKSNVTKNKRRKNRPAQAS